jgi:hypothetical protein
MRLPIPRPRIDYSMRQQLAKDLDAWHPISHTGLEDETCIDRRNLGRPCGTRR